MFDSCSQVLLLAINSEYGILHLRLLQKTKESYFLHEKNVAKQVVAKIFDCVGGASILWQCTEQLFRGRVV